MADKQTRTRQLFARGEHKIPLGGFINKDGWWVTIEKNGWPERTVGKIEIYFIYGTERVFKRSSILAGSTVVDKEGNIITHQTIAGTWPGKADPRTGNRIAQVPDDIEAVVIFDEPMTTEIEVSAVTQTEFNTRASRIRGS